MRTNYDIEVDIRGEIEKGYRLKIKVGCIGMYVDGFTARESNKNPSGWWIQPPAQKIGMIWKKVVEFDTKTEFWAELEESFIRTIKDYNDVLPINGTSNISNEELAYPDFGEDASRVTHVDLEMKRR